MASTRELFRQLTKELRLIYKTDKLHDVPAYTYLENQFRRFLVTGEKECRGEKEASHLASTYLCFLRSTRQLDELHAEHKGKERTTKETAEMLGFLLPGQKPTDAK